MRHKTLDMDSQRLLLAPRSFRYAVEEAASPCGFRLAFFNTTDPADTDPGFFLDIADVSAGRVMFTFLNTSPDVFAITHVYFDDGEMMVIDVVRRAAGKPQTGGRDTRTAIARSAGSPGNQSLHENLAVTFDLNDGIGIADIICALNEERLRVSLKAVRQDSDEILIFTSAPELSLALPWPQ